MPVRIDLANAALGHAGEGYTIADLDTDRSPAGLAIKRFYGACRTAMFAEFSWSWATRTVTATASVEVPPTWRYAYLRPSACAAIQALLSADKALEYGLGGITTAAGEDVALILSQWPASYLRYTRDIANEAHWSAGFARAFEYRLAANICRTIGKDEATRSFCWSQFAAFMNAAMVADQRQAWKEPGEGDFLSARL